MNAGSDPRDAETRATAFGITAGVKPSEARHGMLALVGRYTRSRIRHDERDPIEPARERHQAIHAAGLAAFAAPRIDPGDIFEWFGAASDISAPRNAEAALHKSEAKLCELNAALEQQVNERTAERDRLW